MAITTTIDQWLDDPEALALRLTTRSARTLLGSKSLLVPNGCSALLENPETLLPGGSQRDKLSDMTLIKDARFGLDVVVDRAIDKDGHPHQARVTLTLYIDTTDATALRCFRGHFLGEQDSDCSASTVALRLDTVLNEALVAFIGRHDADALADPAVDEHLEHALRRVLKATLESHGLVLSRVRRAAFRSDDLEQLRAREAERARAEAEEEQRRAELRAQAETVDLQRQLQSEAAGRELASARELALERAALEREREEQQRAIAHDLQNKEMAHRLALAKQAIEELGSADMSALVAQVEDPAARERLYAMLIQQQMTPEQLAALRSQQTAGEVAALQAKLEQLTGQLTSKGPDTPPTARILVATGEGVLAFDPATNVDPTRPRERYEPGSPLPLGLGGVRSIRLGAEDVLLAGARNGVHIINRRTDDARAYLINRQAQGRTGINAVAQLGELLLATHSEFGLLAWDVASNSSGPSQVARDVAREATLGASSVRALVADAEQLYFACDSRVYGLGADLASPRLFSGPVEAVSALVLNGDQLYASTVGGAIYAWYTADPHSPRRVHSRRAKIYSLRPLGQGALLVGSKDRGVLRLDLASGTESTYQATSLVRWAAGASDYVAGVDHDGRSLILWRTDSPESEWRRIPLPSPINDVIFLPRD